MSDNTLRLSEIDTLRLELADEKTRGLESSSELRVTYQNLIREPQQDLKAEQTFAEEMTFEWQEKSVKSEEEPLIEGLLSRQSALLEEIAELKNRNEAMPACGTVNDD